MKELIVKKRVGNKSNLTVATHAIGGRKSSRARVWLVDSGSGSITINGKPIGDYFSSTSLDNMVRKPLVVGNVAKQYDAVVNVKGGGISGQAGAIAHGISRALASIDLGLKSTMRESGLLTRDSRKVERKKYGRKKARKSFQFSKR